MTRRSGLTLVEVLVAIFVMAIGLLALLTLFPLGALNMAQALKDDRTHYSARAAGAIADTYFQDHPPLANPFVPPTRWTLRSDAFVVGGMLNPGGGLPDRTGSTGPSYPVLVDPIGWYTFGTPWVAPSAGYTGIPRRTMRILLSTRAPTLGVTGVDANWDAPPAPYTVGLYRQHQIMRWSVLPDDITFDESGVPTGTSVTAGTEVQREGRYSWAWLVRQPYASAYTTVAQVTVVVYSGRPLELNPGLAPQGENSYAASFGVDPTTRLYNPASRVLTFSWGAGPRPDLRRGGWILDGTMFQTPGGGTADPRGYFYRIVNIIDNGTSMDVEVQTDFKGLPATAAGAAPPTGYIIVLDNVSEVFERLTE